MEKLGAFFAYVVIFACIIMVPLLFWFIYANLAKFDPNIIVGIFAALFTGLVAIRGYSEAKKREIAARHFIQKKAAYMDFIDMIAKLLKKHKDGEAPSEEELLEHMYSFRRELTVWGGTKAIKAFNMYVEHGESKPDTLNILFAMDNLLRAMRKELGHNDSMLNKGEIVGMFLDQAGKEQLKKAAK